MQDSRFLPVPREVSDERDETGRVRLFALKRRSAWRRERDSTPASGGDRGGELRFDALFTLRRNRCDGATKSRPRRARVAPGETTQSRVSPPTFDSVLCPDADLEVPR